MWKIIVRGTEIEYFKLDKVVLNINFFTKRQSHEEVPKKGVKNVELFINEILLKNGFNKDEKIA